MSTLDREPKSIPYARGSDTSRLAAESVRGKLGHIQRRIYDYVASQGSEGSTSDQAELALGLSHQTCSARFNELARKGWFSKTLEKRKTRSGRGARVYVTDRVALDLSRFDTLDDLAKHADSPTGAPTTPGDLVGSLRRGSR